MLKATIMSIPVGLTFVDYFGYISQVNRSALQPSLDPESSNRSDFVFVNRWNSRMFSYTRGQVVCVICPIDPSKKMINRIIALEGDVVKTIGCKHKYLKVPKGHCWIEGVHTGRTLDSNIFGPVAIGLITAKVSHVVWPPSRWGKINSDIPINRMPFKQDADLPSAASLFNREDIFFDEG